MSLIGVLFALAIIIVPTLGMADQFTSPDSPLPLNRQSITKPYIYEVSKDGRTSYLFGTFHIGIGVEQLPSWVTRLHRNAELHAYELKAYDFAIYKEMVNFRTKPEDVIKKYVKNKETKANFSEEEILKLEKLGIPRRASEQMDAKVCANFYFRDLWFKQPHNTLDGELMIYSQKFNRPVLELEDEALREEAEKLVEPSSCDVRDYLSEEGVKAIDAVALENINSYLQGEDVPESEFESGYEDVFYRNQKWMPKLEHAFATKRTFVTVGMFHLYGSEGLINLLRAKDYEVRRLTQDPGDAPGAHHNFER